MTTYRVTLEDGQAFLMEANLSQASAPIRANFHDGNDDGDWQSTPYQTADARHSKMQAAELMARYFKGGPDDCIDVESVEVVK